jgi:uncharacterized membrane protein
MIKLLKNYERPLSLIGLVGFNTALILFRITVTHSAYFGFLLWNLLLSGVPFLMSSFICFHPKMSKWAFFTVCFCWLLFLPNAPYIITDFLHFRRPGSMPPWFDVLLLTSFSFSGILFGLLSMADMQQAWKLRFGNSVAITFIFCCSLLSGFGIYLGRFSRFNSWDIIGNPSGLFSGIASIAFELHTIGFTLGYGALIFLFYFFLKTNSKAL